MSGKVIMGIIGLILGIGTTVAVGASIFNSRRFRVRRVVNRAGDAMYGVGSALCRMSSLFSSNGCEKA